MPAGFGNQVFQSNILPQFVTLIKKLSSSEEKKDGRRNIKFITNILHCVLNLTERTVWRKYRNLYLSSTFSAAQRPLSLSFLCSPDKEQSILLLDFQEQCFDLCSMLFTADPVSGLRNTISGKLQI